MDLSILTENWTVLLPEIVLTLFVIAVMMVDILPGRNTSSSKILANISLVGVIVALAANVYVWTLPDAVYLGGVAADNFTFGVRLVVLVAALLGILLSSDYIDHITQNVGEYYSLLLLTTIGMMLMGSAVDLIVIFLALEIFSLAIYVLCGYHRENPRSSEAGMKYFLLGAFATAFLVYGMALIYGAGGTTNLRLLGEIFNNGGGNLTFLLPGIALVIVGFGFKLSLVPFHMWTPDVYQGAPTPVVAFMSIGTKTAAFAAFLRLLNEALAGQQETWGWMLAALAILTMTVGNLAALRQSSVKRMLAYSSIAHAGYVLVALVPATAEGAGAALFYVFAYAFMNIGAFAVVIALERIGEGDVEQERFNGIANRWPGLALAMSIFMLSLAGIPPLAGFFGKFFVFRVAVESGWVWLVVVGVVNSAISAYYYLRVVVSMYFSESTVASERRNWLGLNLGVALTAIGTVVVGLYPTFWTNLLMGLGG
ncbi:MAG: NADH-quinone oxidoreductase subunit N [Caldilineaceae bacterium]|nr:NADH-quinone oxidoreductase subunit N [Caldilineaceae bacterium]